MSADTDKWFLQWADETGDDAGRPWAGEYMRTRKNGNKDPWDEGCKVTTLIGGHAALAEMRKQLDLAIAEARAKTGAPPKGYVFISGLRLNPLRDLSDANTSWVTDPNYPEGTDPTAKGMILRLMQVGIQVRILVWMPTLIEGEDFAGFTAHAGDHVWLATMVKRQSDRIGGTVPMGIVGLDMRLHERLPQSASHHQKMMIIRVGDVNVAFCGGVDMAFTRHDGPSSAYPYDPNQAKFLAGDWQSGNGIPEGPFLPTMKQPSDLPIDVYGETMQLWHDQHLMLEGPIVDTLDAQFRERWNDPGAMHSLYQPLALNLRVGQVIFSAEGPPPQPLPPRLPDPATPVTTSLGTQKVQMWRTIPLRKTRPESAELARGEFTAMAGIANACYKATELIWIFDQYFWSRPLARLLNRCLSSHPRLRIIIILPPHADTPPAELPTNVAHHARRLALADLTNGLESLPESPVAVYDLWDKRDPGRQKGIYCHAKVHTYDGSLLVCGSVNMNRRSFTSDTELACAVLDQEVVEAHQRQLWTLLFPSAPYPLNIDTGLDSVGSGRTFFEAFKKAAKAGNSFLTPDPWLPSPNGVPYPGTLGNPKGTALVPIESISGNRSANMLYELVLDPTSLARVPQSASLDEWSHKLESVTHRGEWRLVWPQPPNYGGPL